VLNRLAKNKSLRLLFVGFFLFFMVWQPTPAYSAEAWATVTCQDSIGNSQDFSIGWNNEHDYFLDKGNIAQHFCEGGYAGSFTTFVGVTGRDGGELDSSLLYHPGYSPTPTPSPTPISEPSAEDQTTDTTVRTEDVGRTEDVERTEDVARTEEVVREPEPVASVAPVAPAPEPIPQPAPEPSPEPTPEPAPEPEPTPERPEKPVEPTKAPEVLTPSPEPSETPTSLPAPQIPSEPAPEPTLPEEETISVGLALEAVGKLVDNLRSIGSDLSPEVREQAQQVIVASVIVTQVALAGRKP
jgi:hypothetical protein